MQKFDIDVLLDKNPRVDREAIKKRVAEGGFGKPAEQPQGSPSPYGGRRMILDDKQTMLSTIPRRA